MRSRTGVLLLAASLAPLWAQMTARVDDLAPGKFLVARRDLPDPNFEESVVLLIQYDAAGAMGLVVNRRSKIPVSRFLRDIPAMSKRADYAFLGGPVAPDGILALLRSGAPLGDPVTNLTGVSLISTRQLLEKALASNPEASAVRLFAGYSGWGPRQLDREVMLGTWHILKADPATVFDPSPDSVWSRLIRRTELRIALFRAPLK